MPKESTPLKILSQEIIRVVAMLFTVYVITFNIFSGYRVRRQDFTVFLFSILLCSTNKYIFTSYKLLECLNISWCDPERSKT
jgi:hypothetical protein